MNRRHLPRLLAVLAACACFPAQPHLLHAQTSTHGAAPVVLGKLASGATVSFVQNDSREWGIDISGSDTPHLSQARPLRVEVFSKEMAGEQFRDKVQQLAAGYQSVEKTADGAVARSELAYGKDVKFQTEDRWSVNGSVLSVRRTLKVAGSSSGRTLEGGFDSAVMLGTDPQVTWPDLEYMAPTLLYGDTTLTGARSPGGKDNYAARRYGMREDWLAAPLFAMSFRDGNSVAVLDPAPHGETTAAESHSQSDTVMIDERYQFGALGANEAENGGVEFGFWLPGSVVEAGRGAASAPVWRRRYHPLKDGLAQNYQVEFRLARDGTFAHMTRNTWRWAWDTLRPQPAPADVELIRRTLLDQLAGRVMTIEGRTGIPYLEDSRTGKFQERMDATRAAMGFCAKNIEAADQFLREADRDPSARGKHMRELGLAIIDTFIRILPMSPPAGDGFDLFTGRISPAVWSVGKQFLRPITEDMLVLVNAYHREKALGREHPEWLRWAQDFSDWLLTQQRTDGSFPRSWKPGSGEVVDADGESTNNAPPLLLAMYRETGEKKYLDSAVRAGEYVWETDGIHGVFHGGATDASSSELVTDKEAGHLSLLAFLDLYEDHEAAQVAGTGQSGGRLHGNLDLDLECSHAGGRRRRSDPLEERRADHRPFWNHRPWPGRSGPVRLLGGTDVCAALYLH